MADARHEANAPLEARRRMMPRSAQNNGISNDRNANLRQSLPAAGIIEESESAQGERGRVGQGRVGFRVQARACWVYATCLFKKMVFDNENVLWLDLRSQMKP